MATITRSMQALEELDRGQKATDYLVTMVRYIISARDDMSYIDMHDAVKNVSPKGGELLMTIAEKLRNEGIEMRVKKRAWKRAWKKHWQH